MVDLLQKLRVQGQAVHSQCWPMPAELEMKQVTIASSVIIFLNRLTFNALSSGHQTQGRSLGNGMLLGWQDMQFATRMGSSDLRGSCHMAVTAPTALPDLGLTTRPVRSSCHQL